MEMNIYEVIVSGGGPSGVATAIELGLHGIKTLVLEKHDEPMYSARAQFLNSRTMELMLRWDTCDALRKENMLDISNLIWCSGLNGETYSSVEMREYHNNHSPEESIHIPLWVTEGVLRSRLSELNSVKMLKNTAVTEINNQNDDLIQVKTKNRKTNQTEEFYAKYVIGCDGVNSVVRNALGINFSKLASGRRMTNILFEAPDLFSKTKIDKAMVYFTINNQHPGVVGTVDPNNNLWYSLFYDESDTKNIEDLDIDSIINKMVGFEFDKKIVSATYWDMQVKLADAYSKNNRIFLVGESAHSFAPTGGLGLNTAFGDASNLAWKLAHVIKGKLPEPVLSTYEQERRSIAYINLTKAEENAKALIDLSLELSSEEYTQAYANLSRKHALSAGIGMGYAYFDSPLVKLHDGQSTEPMEQSKYDPKDLPGYFLPNVTLNGKSIYRTLSATDWTLIVSGNKCDININGINVIELPKNTYSSTYILVRPDWHISYASNKLDIDTINWLVNFGK
ncbi:FAD-dependent monooxygenase [Francisella sp. 19X1-34]|uniref:FAD-dependent monooxygenase n=1 Tax=Francisella sp. 19X1-34 TaxID=3087177 RepID=UPI002E365C5F|nr:FAD-dependent monooxygenase [Francisella sp. 19X1-34]MED7789599.1 FAD-dependent monooxygenase [Francisella sp. 19X1-34]